MKYRRVEFLLAMDDHTWTTHVLEVPADKAQTEADCLKFGNDTILPLARFRKVALVAIYHMWPLEG